MESTITLSNLISIIGVLSAVVTASWTVWRWFAKTRTDTADRILAVEQKLTTAISILERIQAVAYAEYTAHVAADKHTHEALVQSILALQKRNDELDFGNDNNRDRISSLDKQVAVLAQDQGRAKRGDG